MTKEKLRDALSIDEQINKTIEKIDMFDPGRQLIVGFKLKDKSGTLIKLEFFPGENEKEVFEVIRSIYLRHLIEELQSLREKFKNL